jgi:hypothetical protein
MDRFHADTEVKRLKGRTERRGAATGLPTWGAFLFGTVFVLAGTGIVLVGTRVFEVDPEGVHAPYWVITAMGVCFALAGLVLWGMTLRQYRAQRYHQAMLAAHPGNIALLDRPWDRSGERTPRFARAWRTVASAAGLSLFLAPFNWWAFLSDDSNWLVIGVTSLFDLVALFVWWEGLRLTLQGLRFGGARLEYRAFPYSREGRITLRWWPPRGLTSANKGQLTLRVVREWYEQHGSGKQRTVELVHEQQWAGTWSLAQVHDFQPERPVELTFDLPPGLPPSALSAERPVFWEFEVVMDIPGVDFEATYLVPVY